MPDSSDRSSEKLGLVFSTNDELEAGMVQELLRNAGIESMINSPLAPGLFPMNVTNLATKEIFVLESEAEAAKRLIAEQHEGGGEPAE
jgi:hypothetical protein